MKYSRSKWLLLVLAIVMCVSLFAGCSNNSASDDNNNVKPAEETKAPPAKEAEPATAEPTVAEPTEIEIMVMTFQEPPDLNNEYYTELQKMTNTKLNITWVPDADYDTRFDLVLASGDIPEVIIAKSYSRPTLTQALDNNVFWDLTPLLGDFSKFPNLKDKQTPGSWKYVEYKGKIMGIPRSRSLIDSGIKIRKDWLEELNIPAPTTLDEFTEALKKIAAAKPGVSATVMDPFSNSGSIWVAYGVTDPTFDSEGGMIRDILTPQFADMVEWFRGLYAAGLMPKEFTALNNNQKFDLMTTGKAASIDYGIYRDHTWTADLQKIDPKAQLFTLAPLQGPKNLGAQLDIGTRGGIYISKKVPEEKALKILEYFDKTASDEVTDLAYYGKEGVHHTVVDGQPMLNDLGKEQIQVTALNPLSPAYRKWGKVQYSGVSKAVNEAKFKEVEKYEEVGVINPFRWLYSQAWTDAWPEFDSTFQSNVLKATVGDMSMDAFRKYQEDLRNNADLKVAFQEFAEDYKARGSQ